MRTAVFAATLSLAVPATASDFVLGLPIDCILGETCHIQQFVDRDPGPGARDYRCGTLSYDGHKGTDFALPTLREMRAGVAVLAAAPGIVAALRDGMPDQPFSEDAAADIEGRECGNGVVLRHNEGYETQYCHMKSGSLIVRKGQQIERGAVLGQVGLSGRTQFPHLHLSLRRDGMTLDPFDADMTENCAPGDAHFWRALPAYRPGGLLTAGFAPEVPDYDDIRAGNAARADLPTDAPGLVLFGFAFGGRKGDVMTLEIDGPAGALVSRSMTLDKDQARFFRATGKRLQDSGWPVGRYSGVVTLTRDGKPLDRRDITVTVK